MIDFSNGLNTIVGPSRTGKTSIIRALAFALFDQWHDKFIRTGATSTTVSVWFDNGLYISREKGPTVNKITLITKEGNAQVYEKFGQEMPLEVRKLIGIFPAKIDVDYEFNLNLSEQDDSAFLLKASAPTKTKFMNRLTGAHVVDSALRTLNKERGDIKEDITKLNSEIETHKSKLDAFVNLDSIKSFVDSAFAKTNKVDKLLGTYTTISDIKTRLNSIKNRTLEINKFVSWYDSVDVKFNSFQMKSIILNTLYSLRQLYREHNHDLGNITQNLNIIKEQQDQFIKDNKICPLCGKILEGQFKW